MVRLTCYGSSSKGNGYLIEEGDYALMLDAGIAPKGSEKINDLFISHYHTDHSKYVDRWAGLPPQQLAPSSGGNEQNGNIFYPMDHDVPTYGGVFTTPKGVTISYITDTANVDQLPGHMFESNIILIETNWSELTIDDGLYHSKRARKTHLSLEKALDAVWRTSDNLQALLGIHLSDTNSDRALFEQQLCGEVEKKKDGVVVGTLSKGVVLYL